MVHWCCELRSIALAGMMSAQRLSWWPRSIEGVYITVSAALLYHISRINRSTLARRYQNSRVVQGYFGFNSGSELLQKSADEWTETVRGSLPPTVQPLVIAGTGGRVNPFTRAALRDLGVRSSGAQLSGLQEQQREGWHHSDVDRLTQHDGRILVEETALEQPYYEQLVACGHSRLLWHPETVTGMLQFLSPPRRPKAEAGWLARHPPVTQRLVNAFAQPNQGDQHKLVAAEPPVVPMPDGEMWSALGPGPRGGGELREAGGMDAQVMMQMPWQSDAATAIETSGGALRV